MTSNIIDDWFIAHKFNDVAVFSNYDYDYALIGVTLDGRAIYDYSRMVAWLVVLQDFSVEDAIEWIDYNTIRALPYGGPLPPMIVDELNSDLDDAIKELRDEVYG